MSYTQNNEPYNDNVINKLLNDDEINKFLKKIKIFLNETIEKKTIENYITDFDNMLQNTTTNEKNFFNNYKIIFLNIQEIFFIKLCIKMLVMNLLEKEKHEIIQKYYNNFIYNNRVLNDDELIENREDFININLYHFINIYVKKINKLNLINVQDFNNFVNELSEYHKNNNINLLYEFKEDIIFNLKKLTILHYKNIHDFINYLKSDIYENSCYNHLKNNFKLNNLCIINEFFYFLLQTNQTNQRNGGKRKRKCKKTKQKPKKSRKFRKTKRYFKK